MKVSSGNSPSDEDQTNKSRSAQKRSLASAETQLQVEAEKRVAERRPCRWRMRARAHVERRLGDACQMHERKSTGKEKKGEKREKREGRDSADCAEPAARCAIAIAGEG